MKTGIIKITKIFDTLVFLVLFTLFLTACTADQRMSMDSMPSRVRPCRGNAEAHYQLACYYQDRHRHREALEEFKKILTINPNDIRAYNVIGISSDALQDFPRAFLAYEKALKLNPQAGYIYNNLGYSYYLQKRYYEAVLTFRKAVDQPNEAVIINKISNNLNMALALSEKPQMAATGQQGVTEKPKTSPEALLLSSNLDQEHHIKNLMIRRNPLAAYSPLPSDSLRKCSVTVEVANGNGVRNMARSVGDYLKNRGYRVVSITNADSYCYRKGNISYRPDGQTTAREIAAIFPNEVYIGKLKEGKRKNVRVRVLIGEDLIPFKKVFMEDKG